MSPAQIGSQCNHGWVVVLLKVYVTNTERFTLYSSVVG